MAVRLDYDDTIHGYCIGWWDGENDINGDLCLGENVDFCDADDHKFITKQMPKIFPPDYIRSQVFYWDTEASVKKALRVANQLLDEFKNKGSSTASWPDWAVKAKSEGWKP